MWRTARTYIRERGEPSTWLLTLVHRRASTSFGVSSGGAATGIPADAPGGDVPDGGGGDAPGERRRAVQAGAEGSFPPTSVRRSSSRTTAGSRSRSSPRSSAFP